MAEPVAEVLAVARGLDHRARHCVDLATAGAGVDRIDARQLGLQHELVDLAGLVARLAGRDRARAVRAVAVELGAPVDHDHLPRPDLDVAWLGVRQRPVRPGGDDRVERRPLSALLAHRPLERVGELTLGPPDEPLVDDLRKRCVGGGGRRADPRDLIGVLDARRRSTSPPAATSSTRSGSSSRSATCWRTVTLASSNPSRISPSGISPSSTSNSSC